MMDPKNSDGGSLSVSDINVGAGRLAKNTAWNFIGYATPLVIGLATLPFVIRGLGTSRFGILSLVWVILGYFGFLDLGLGRATIRYIADAIGRRELKDIPKYFWTTILIQLALAAVGTVILMAATPLLVERILKIPVGLITETKTAFILTALSLPVVMASASFRGVLEAAQRFDLVNAVKIPSSSANYLIPLISLFVWRSMVGIVVMLLAMRILTLGFWIVLSFRQFPILRCRPVFYRETLRPLIAFGGWATVSSLIGSILENLDRFAIGAMLSVQAVGYYTAPYEAIGRLGILPASLITALFPAFSVLKGGLAEEKIRDIFARGVKYVLIVTGTLIVPLVFLARMILRLWLGEDLAVHSTLVFQLIGASFLFVSFSYLAFGLLQGIGRTDLPAKIHLLLFVVYIPLLWIGIRLGGIDGAALAWFLHLGLQAGLQFRAARRLGYADLRNFLRIGVGRTIAALALFSIVAGLLGLLIPTLPAVAAGAAVYLPLVWLWVLSGEERQWLSAQRRKIIAGRPIRPPEGIRLSRRPPRILIVGLVPPEMGGGLDCGVATHVWDLAQQTARRGFEITILAPLGRRKSYRDESGIEVLNATRSRFSRSIRSLAFSTRLPSACRSNLSFLSLREKIGVLAWTRTLAETLRQWKPDLIHIHPLGHPLALGLDCLDLRIPTVLTDHGFWQDVRGERDLEKIRRVAGKAAGIIAVSRYCVEQQDRLGIQVKGKRAIIRSPFDFPSALVPSLPAVTSPVGRKVVLFAAGVEPVRRKGLDLVLDAFVRNDDLRKTASLHIVTNEEGRDFAEPIMKTWAITGRVFPCQHRSRLMEMVAAADTVVLPSRSEAFGLVLLEAVAAGVPVVGFAPTIGEFRDCMKIDVGEPFDANREGPDDLARKIQSVLSRSFDRKVLAEKTREAFSWDTLFPLYDKFYREAIGS